jgi:hypothetical protein
MDALTHARQLTSEGRFSDALAILQSSTTFRSLHPATGALWAELLERLGRADEAHDRIDRLLRSRMLTPPDRSLSYYVLGRIEASRGRLDAAVAHLQKSVSIASSIKAFDRLVWAQCRLLLIVSDASGLEAVGPLLSELRLNAARSGDPRLLAAVHLFVAQTEAQRGLLSSAARHLTLAAALLETSPHVWLSFVHENIWANIAIVDSNFDRALAHARESERLSKQCGDAITHAVTLCNLGHLLYLTGHLDEAFQNCSRALAVFSPGSDNACGAIDTLAQIRLCQGQLDESERLIAEIRPFHPFAAEPGRYVHRHSLITRSRLSACRGEVTEALQLVDSACVLARRVCDGWLLDTSLLTKARFLSRTPANGVSRILHEVGLSLPSRPPDVYAHFERVAATALAGAGNHEAAFHHRERANRIYIALQQQTEAKDFAKEWTALSHKFVAHAPVETGTANTIGPVGSASIVNWLGSFVILADRPELLAQEVFGFLRSCEWVLGAKLARSSDADDETEIEEFGVLPALDGAQRRVLIFEGGRERRSELTIVSKEDVEMLEDLILAAFQDAKVKADAAVQAKMQEVTGGLNLPPGLKLF